jgi:hypothetical protein
MKVKLLGIDYTNEVLLNILPFETGYLLRDDNTPCEQSVQLAMMLRSVEFASNPHGCTLMLEPYVN